MAVITLVADTNFSALAVASGDTIALNGFKLTLDVAAPSATNVTVDATGNAGTVTATVNLTVAGWVFKAGTAILCDIPFGRRVTGATFVGGSVFNAHGLRSNSGSNVFTSCTFIGGSVSGAYGVQQFGTTTYSNCSFIGGSASGAHGFASSNASQHTIDSTNTAQGGSVSGASGLAVSGYGAIDSPTLSTSVPGAYALDNSGGCPVLLDVRKLTGLCVNRSNVVSNIVLYGGTSTANVAGSLGTLRTVPAPADVRSGTPVMGETGTLAPGGVSRSRAFGGAM